MGKIYCIENLINNKKYIGRTIQKTNNRFNAHKSFLNRNIHTNSHLQNSWNMYGEESFIFYYIEESCEDSRIDEIEQFYIEKYNTTDDKYGYNKKTSGEKIVFSEETKQKMSDNHADFSGENNGMWNKKHSNETRKLMSVNRPDFSGKNHPLYGKKMRKSSSKYLGVSKSENGKYKYYIARITENGRTINIGSSKSEEEAAKMYDEYVIKNKINRPLNF